MQPTLEQLKFTLDKLAFIHQKLTTVQFYPEEFKQADASIRLIIEMAEKVSADVQALTATPVVEKEVANEQA